MVIAASMDSFKRVPHSTCFNRGVESALFPLSGVLRCLKKPMFTNGTLSVLRYRGILVWGFGLGSEMPIHLQA